MAKKKSIDFPFYIYLKHFHDNNRKKIYAKYSNLSRKFLDYNDPENKSSWLRPPQFEALEMYIFLKEFLHNEFVYKIFSEWYNREGDFEGRDDMGYNLKTGSYELFGPKEFDVQKDKKLYKKLFDQYNEFEQHYPNYIFALTMGVGKTVLMATSIFYEFLLANKYPKDKRFCHNALVFAPDKTVLESLREIMTLDKTKVVPPEYVPWLDMNLKFYFLDDTGISLQTIDSSRFNIIISNTQKIILKRSHKKNSISDELFEDKANIHRIIQEDSDYSYFDFDLSKEKDLMTNQRFEKLTRLEQLGIYVDEAHHIFGNDLKKAFGLRRTKTSLRTTIDELAKAIKQRAESRVVGCYNYTGTPYVEKTILPDVVYAYGLKDAINNSYLKKVDVFGYTNIKNRSYDFIRRAISSFWEEHQGKRYEGMLPKMAIFASTIEELQKDVRPTVEKVLGELGIPTSSILVNVGDDKITKNDDIREFIRLDTVESEKQFILLVGKGKEGWNCRSLFSVALHRKPHSKVFVLQATMRCLRSISDVQQTGQVFLSDENVKILENELKDNFNVSLSDIKDAGKEGKIQHVYVKKPPVKIKLKRIKRLYQLKERNVRSGIDFDLENIDTEKYKIIETESALSDLERKKQAQEIKHSDTRIFSRYTLIAEIGRYLYHPGDVDNVKKIGCIEIEKALVSSKDGIDKILIQVNQYNGILFDVIIPKLFNHFFEIDCYEKNEEEEIELVKHPEKGYYEVKAKDELVFDSNSERFETIREKSFHLDKYCFDSIPESEFFWRMINSGKVDKIWFTGMLTHGQSDFLIRYIDPESLTVRSYYPDFLIKKATEDDKEEYIIVEIKGDNRIDDSVVKAKADFTNQITAVSGMTYQIVKGSEANKGISLGN